MSGGDNQGWVDFDCTSSDGGDASDATQRLLERTAELEPGERATFVRVSDADPEMLRFLGERHIVPGTGLELVERQPFDGPLFVRAGEDVHVLGATLARAMRVEREGNA